MVIDGEEIRFRGVRKRKWGKYVAEIRSRKRSRISLGSYSTAYAAARAYDTALFCLRGPNATSFNFPDSRFNSTAMVAATEHTNPSSHIIRAAAIAVGSAYDRIPRDDSEEAGPSTAAGSSVEEAAPIEVSMQSREAVKDETDQVTEEEENEARYLLESPEHILFEESVQMAPLQLDSQVVVQPYDQSEFFLNLATWDAAPNPHTSQSLTKLDLIF